jgi:predicted phage terminase large subunit-like protein
VKERRPHEINPLTGKRYAWEAEQEAKRAADPKAQAAELKKELALLERQQAILDARDHLMPFSRFVMPDPEAPNDVTRSLYEPAAVHDEVAGILTKFVKEELRHSDGRVCRRVIFCMPPRHGKTQLATKNLAAWASGLHPEWDIGIASYSDTMATDFGADIRSIMGTPQFKQVFPAHKLRRGGTAKDNIQTDKGGRMVAVGRGGALTGRGMCLGLGDDLFKDHEEARSQAVRDAAWNWFTKVFMTRRMGPQLVMLTMTLWHPDDVIGRITDPANPHYDALEAKEWMIIRLPALAEENDPLGRAEGEPLWPERYDTDFLHSQRRLDPLGFSALYQQRPTVADGVMFRRENIQRYDPADLPDNLRWYCTSDHAVGTKQRNDPSCFLKAGVDPQNNIWLTDIFWKRAPADQAVEAMLAMAGGNRRPLFWWAERGHISKSIGPFLRKRMLESGTYINMIEVTPVQDKETRAQSIAAWVALGKVLIPKGPIWDRMVDEMLAFPNGLHDDAVDALALFGLGLQSQHGAKPKVRAVTEKPGTMGWLKRQTKLAETHRAGAW